MSDPWDDAPVTPPNAGDVAALVSQHYQRLIANGLPAELAAQLTRDFHTEAIRRLLLNAPLPQPLPDLRIPMLCGSSKGHASRALTPHSLALG